MSDENPTETSKTPSGVPNGAPNGTPSGASKEGAAAPHNKKKHKHKHRGKPTPPTRDAAPPVVPAAADSAAPIADAGDPQEQTAEPQAQQEQAAEPQKTQTQEVAAPQETQESASQETQEPASQETQEPQEAATPPPQETVTEDLRLRMKIWTDPQTGKRYLMPAAFMRDIVNGQPVTDAMYAYAMRDDDTKLVTLTAREWNSLPFCYFREDGPAPRATARPVDAVVFERRPRGAP